MMETENKKNYNIPIRLTEKQYNTIVKAASKTQTPPSTWMRRMALSAAGDSRSLKDLLKAWLAGMGL